MVKAYKVQTLTDIDYKITAVECFKDRVYAGDNKGMIVAYVIQNPDSQYETLVPAQISTKIGKNKVERLRVAPDTDVIFALSDGNLSYYDCNLLSNQKTLGKSVNLFALNEAGGGNNVLVVQRKKIQIYVFNPASLTYSMQSDNLSLGDVPVCIAWFGNSICVGYQRKNYHIINCKTGSITDIDLPLMQSSVLPFVKVVDDQFFCLWGSNLLIPFDAADGAKSLRSPIPFTDSRNLIGVSYKSPYLAIMLEGALEIYNCDDSSLVQQENYVHGSQGVSMASSTFPMIFATTFSIYALRPIPMKEQIKNLLLECKVNEAKMLQNKNIPFDATNREEIWEQFNLDAAWSLFRNLNFSESVDYFLQTNFDPRDVISLFPGLCSDRIYIPNTKRDTIAMIVSNYIEQGARGDRSSINKIVEDKNTTCKLCVIQLLKNRRQNISRPSKQVSGRPNKLEKFAFMTSEYAINKINKEEINREEVLQMIDTFLLKMYVELSASEDSQAKLNEKFGCDATRLLEELFEANPKSHLNFNDCEGFLRGREDKASNAALAMLYENFNRKVDALNLWKSVGTNPATESNLKEQAARQTVKILLKTADKQTIFNYAGWVLETQPSIGLQIFTSPEESHHLSYDIVCEQLDPYDNREANLIELYLQYLINEKQVDTERFHTRLGLIYVEKLFDLVPKTARDANPRMGGDLFTVYKKKLETFLEKSNNYRTQAILSEIQGTWMLEAEILLYGKEKQHEKALSLLVESKDRLRNNFERAEQYCLNQTEPLISKLLKIYIDKVEVYKSMMENANLTGDGVAEDYRKDMEIFQEKSIKLMQKYATHIQMDTVDVLDIIPDDWHLNSVTSSLHSYLYASVSHSLHQIRTAMIKKNISKMDHESVDIEWSEKRKASVRVAADRVCAACKKKISDRVIVVYPNGICVHFTCMVSPTICPVTQTNFESLA